MRVFNDDGRACRRCGDVPPVLKGKNSDLCPACHAELVITTYCTLTTGSFMGRPFELLSWEQGIIRRAFGTLKPDGTRQYRYVYVEVPKKNGKTELGGALALYLTGFDDEPGAQVYSAAADREQAGLVYNASSQMVVNSPLLSRAFKNIDSRKRIIYHGNGGCFYQVLSSDVKTKHGINPSGIIFDELHAQPNHYLWDTLVEGTESARDQQLVIVLTTAGVYDLNSIAWEVHAKARAIYEGKEEDDSFLPIFYSMEPEEAHAEVGAHADGSKKYYWETAEAWEKVNPSWGTVFNKEKIASHYNEVRGNPRRINNFLRFRLNVWTSSVSRYLSMADWDACPGGLDQASLLGSKCYGGLDLASTTDLTSFALAFEPDESGIIDVLVRFWVPEAKLRAGGAKIDQVDYSAWVDAGWIQVTDGVMVDYTHIIKEVVGLDETHDIQEIGFDPWNATQTAVELQDQHGLTMVKMRQGMLTMSAPCKQVEGLVLAHKINHGGNPVLRWNADNMMVRTDANDNVQPAKDKSNGRIDGMVALIMAVGRLMLHTKTSSVYEERGVRSI